MSSTGAAGDGQVVELRALSVDSGVRRAHCEQRHLSPSRAEVELAWQAFGVRPGPDDLRRHRASAPTLGEAARPPTILEAVALEFGNIDGLTKRRHFHGAAPPGSFLSPRQAAAALEQVDIDSQPKRGCSRRAASAEGVAPFDKEGYDAFSRSRRHFFESHLEARRYAALLGRSYSRPVEEEVSDGESQRLREREQGWQSFSSPKCPGFAKGALSPRRLPQRGKRHSTSSSASTAASAPGDSSRSTSGAASPELSLLSGAASPDVESECSENEQSPLKAKAKDAGTGEHPHPTPLALGLRRVLHSLLPGEDAHQLQHHRLLRGSAARMQELQGIMKHQKPGTLHAASGMAMKDVERLSREPELRMRVRRARRASCA